MQEDLFRPFFEQTQRPLLAYLRRVSGNRALAEDLLQESYLRFLDRPPAAPELVAQRVYLFTIATRLLRDHWRRQQHSSWLPWRWGTDEDNGLPEPEDEAPDPCQTAADRQLIALGFRSLSPRQRQLLWLAYVEGLDHRELAQAMGVSPGSVRVLLHRARKRINVELGNLTIQGEAS